MEGSIPDLEDSVGRSADEISNVTLLLPVWGYRFTRRFLDFCLPTLLSPTNVPALARELPCRFVLLSSEHDEPYITSHPAWQKLAKLCAVEILRIDDLITGSNHSATLTLAFERALRQTNQPLRRTCFIFLMSDYLVADGSLTAVLKRIRNGASGVLVGNFQVVAEDVGPFLQTTADRFSSEIIFRPRDLLRFSLAHLHPATIANIVNFGLTHNAHCNRLFWQVDKNTLIGRFYLMHPIAIHPEVDDFTVGSSWDYSFIPELCPSGNITILTDSDEYLVVEMQGRQYESEHLRAGPIGDRELAQSLSEWTTERHRLNVEQSLIFHAGDLPAELPAALAQFGTFVTGVQKLLASPPISHRQHPYWIGSLAAHVESRALQIGLVEPNRSGERRPLARDDWKLLLSRRRPVRLLRATLRRARQILLGLPPDVSRLHPLWPDFRLAAKSLRDSLDAGGRVLLITQQPVFFAEWMARQQGGVFLIGCADFLDLSRATYRSLVGTFDSVLLVLDEKSLVLCDALISHCGPLLLHSGSCNLLIVNERPLSEPMEFERSYTNEAGRLWGTGISIDDVQYTECGILRWLLRGTFINIVRQAVSSSRAVLACAVFAVGPLLLGSYVANWTFKFSRKPPSGIWSSVFVALRFSAGAAEDSPSARDVGNRPAG